MKIGFFGDSFAAEDYNLHTMMNRYETYIKQLSKHYNAEIVNLGHGGCSIWDTILIQLQPLIKSNSLPDICVFVWTNPGRLFHREVRRLNHADTLRPKLHTYNIFKHEVWSAAKQYYLHLYDDEQVELSHMAILHYIDNVILPSLPSNIKFIHTWTAANPMVEAWAHSKSFHPSNISYPYKWKHGVEIRPPLLSLSLCNQDIKILQVDRRANHLEGVEKNTLLANWIKLAVEKYKDGLCLDYSSEVSKFWQ